MADLSQKLQYVFKVKFEYLLSKMFKIWYILVVALRIFYFFKLFTGGIIFNRTIFKSYWTLSHGMSLAITIVYACKCG